MTIQEYLNIIDTTKSYTPQLYGLAYLLIESKKEFKSIEPTVAEWLISAVRNIKDAGDELRYIHEGENPRNYYSSHYYNFALNLLCYVALKRFDQKDRIYHNEIAALLPDIAKFLNHECNKLNNHSMKTIGFELLVGRFLPEVDGFTNKSFLKEIKQSRNNRLKKFSATLAFSPEGITGFFTRFKVGMILKKLISNNAPETYVANSPESSIYFIEELTKRNSNAAKTLKQFICEEHGLPAFFKGEYYDIFWSIDIMHSAGILDEDMKEKVSAKLKQIGYLSEVEGSFTPSKGFSIGKGFRLYDLDTTAVGLRAMKLLGDENHNLDVSRLDYYKNHENGLFHTFKDDNRLSVTVLAHTASYLAFINQYSEPIVNFINSKVEAEDFVDKFHLSTTYVVYCILVAYVDMYTKLGRREVLPNIKKLIAYLQSLQKSDGLYSSVYSSAGSIEETAWTILALNYVHNNLQLDNELFDSTGLRFAINKVSEVNNVVELERLWVVKQIYTPIIINGILIESVKQLKWN